MGKQRAEAAITRIGGPEDFRCRFDVSRETIERLEIYVAMLRQWQKAVNLVASGTLPDVWHRHIADSAQLAGLAPDAATWLDLGSGAGFPGLVVAIMRIEAGMAGVTLVESDSRKCAFLREVARSCAIAVDILDQRIESAATQARVGRVDVVSARALAPLPRLLRLSAPFLSPHTLCLFLKGRGAAEEIEQARAAWDFDAEFVPSCTDEDARIAVIRRVAAKLEG